MSNTHESPLANSNVVDADFSAALDHHLEAIKHITHSAETNVNADAVRQFDEELNQLSQWLHDKFDEFMQILAVSTELNKGLLLEDVLERIYTFFKQVIPYDRIGCALVDEGGESITAFWAHTAYQTDLQISKGYSARLQGTSLETVLSSGRPRIINDLEQHLADHPHSDSTRRILAEGIRSSLTCPLVAEGKAVGVLFFSSRSKDTYQDIHQETFLFLATQVAQLLEKSKLYQHILDLNTRLQDANNQLQEKASRDPLTGMLNRGAILEFLHDQLTKSNRSSIGLLMLDIDHFKRVNDNYGHVSGDLVLRVVTKTMAQHIRPSDRIGRYGGEEFLAVLTDVTAEQLTHIAERIRAAVANTPIQLDPDQVMVTASIGGYLIETTADKEITKLIETVDARLYRAKESGRNRVISCAE